MPRLDFEETGRSEEGECRVEPVGEATVPANEHGDDDDELGGD